MSKKELDIKVKMISAVTEALSYKRKNPLLENEKVIKHISKFVSKESKGIQFAMIAASSKALSITEKNSKLTDKEIIKKVLVMLPLILDNVDK